MTTTTTRRIIAAQRAALSGALPQMNRTDNRAALQTKARHLIDRMERADREALAEYALIGITYTAETLSAARAEAAQQYPNATRRQLRKIAEDAAAKFEQNDDYQQERGALFAEQVADAVGSIGPDVLLIDSFNARFARFAPEMVAA